MRNIPSWGEPLDLVDIGAGPVTIARAFGPLAAALPFISAGMSVIGGAMTAISSISAGNTAAANAEARNQQMRAQAQQQEQQAAQHRAAANAEAATGQREAIERYRKGRIMASRAQAVMAASGAGVDDTLTAGLLAEGDYAADVALFEGDERARVQRNAGTVADWNADNLRRGGAAVAAEGQRAQSAGMFSGAASFIGSGARAGLAFKYGGEYAGATPSSPADAMEAYRNAPASYTRPGMEIF